MLACQKSAYNVSSKAEYTLRFNILRDEASIDKMIEGLVTPSKPIKVDIKEEVVSQWIQRRKRVFSKGWTKQIIKNTLMHMFDNYTSTIFVTIRNRKPELYIIYNTELNNLKTPILNKLRLPCKLPPWIRVRATGCLLNFELKNDKEFKPFSCNGKEMIDKEWYKTPSYTPIFYYDEFKRFLEYLCKHRAIPDMDFVINYKDQIIAPQTLKSHQMLPIYSNCTAEGYNDIPILTPDELIQIFNIHSISRDCKNPYKGLKTPAWKDRISTAVFRGSATGCGNDVNNNMRFALAALDAAWKKNNMYNEKNTIDGKPFLDAGVVSWGTRRMKVIRGTNRANYPNMKALTSVHGIKLKPFMTMQEQRDYKYVLYVEGNVLAYRLGYLFSTKSVVFYVKSAYKPWFYDKLKHKENCIMIESNLSNLAENITWCKKNDGDAHKIAKSGYNLYKDIIGNKDYVMDYMEQVLI